KPTKVVPRVEEPVPPLVMPNIPETSEEPKATAPMFNSPATLRSVERRVGKESRVERLTGILNKLEHVVEETWKIGRVWLKAEVREPRVLVPVPPLATLRVSVQRRVRALLAI